MVTLDAGSRDGVKPELTVLSGQGLVGRVVRVGPTTCDVLLLTDPTFSVGVRLEASGLIGVASGNGDLPMSLKLLDAQTKVVPGARLVTLGSAGGSPFVPGVPVGEVRRCARRPARCPGPVRSPRTSSPPPLDLVGDRRPAAAQRPARRRAAARDRTANPDRHLDRHRPSGGARMSAAPAPCWRPGCVVLAQLLDVESLARWSWPGATPDLTLLVVVALALLGGPASGARAGLSAGLLADLAPPAIRTARADRGRLRPGRCGRRPLAPPGRAVAAARR